MIPLFRMLFSFLRHLNPKRPQAKLIWVKKEVEISQAPRT
jgi:hypothetical protein